MKIEDSRIEQTLKFSVLQEGDMFLYKTVAGFEYCLKIKPHTGEYGQHTVINAVNLMNGNHEYFGDECEVIPMFDAKVVIE